MENARTASGGAVDQAADFGGGGFVAAAFGDPGVHADPAGFADLLHLLDFETGGGGEGAPLGGRRVPDR